MVLLYKLVLNFFGYIGPKACKNPDPFLAPLVEELQALWEGVPMVDMTKKKGEQNFICKGMLLWTMHDWPGLGSCSGLKTSGYEACYKCGPDLRGRRSTTLQKVVYHEHRRRLPMDDPMRRDTRHWPEIEDRPCPMPRSLEDYHELSIEVSNGKMTAQEAGIHRWSVFFNLPYWKVML